jgi:hypothetical protein
LTHTSEAQVAQRVLDLLKTGPKDFYAILKSLADVEYRTILIAWGSLREQDLLGRDDEGRYLLADKQD